MQYVLSKLFTNALLISFLVCAPFQSFAQSSDRFLKQTTSKNIAEDDLSGEDRVIRAAALEALGTAAGTVVVMNAQTGRVYSIVNQDWAISRGFKPCSTIKLVTAVGGVTERLIKPNGNLKRSSHRLDLNDALAFSNNTYFQKVGSRLGSKKMIDYAKELGLGHITGINAEDEFAGKLPYGNENLRIYSHADDFEVTPLQLAVMVSALTNGGKVLVPQISRSNYREASFTGYLRRYLDFAPTLYERVIPGMVGAVNYGTAKRINDSRRNIAGKTGSCIFNKTWIGLFASVAPIKDPRFAVVVITRGKYARGKYSAAIAGKIYKTLEPRFNDKFNTVLAKYSVKKRKKGRNTPLTGSVASKAARKPIPTRSAPPRITNTVITYKKDQNPPRTTSKRKNTVNEKRKPVTLYINGKAEIVRPRVVQQ